MRAAVKAKAEEFFSFAEKYLGPTEAKLVYKEVAAKHRKPKSPNNTENHALLDLYWDRLSKASPEKQKLVIAKLDEEKTANSNRWVKGSIAKRIHRLLNAQKKRGEVLRAAWDPEKYRAECEHVLDPPSQDSTDK
jgi:hypothetical protein